MKDILKKKEQKIFQSIKFYVNINKLIKFRLVDSKYDKNTSEKIYFLTPLGKLRANLIGYDKNTPKKYLQYIFEINIPNITYLHLVEK